MRYLHKPTLREQFVASGKYRFTLHGAALEGVESFAVYELPDGAHFIRIDSDWREHDGSSVLAEALYQPQHLGGHIDRFVTHTIFGGDTLRETFAFFEDKVLVGYDDENYTRQDHEQPMPLGYAVVLGMPSIIGREAAHLADSGAPCTTYRGFDTIDLDSLVETMFARYLADEAVHVDGKAVPARKLLLVSNERPDDSQTLWVDARGVMLRLESPDGQIIQLTDYAYRP